MPVSAAAGGPERDGCAGLAMDQDTEFQVQRRAMVAAIDLHMRTAAQQMGDEALSPTVMAVMGEVPRHEFVPVELRTYAYLDQPLPIGCDKTISQPFIVALMTHLLDIRPTDTVLEVGTGLGYQAAVLSRLAKRVYSVEIIEELAKRARGRLKRLKIGNVDIRVGDGAQGWPEHAPFDRIILTAAPHLIPPALLVQLKKGGRMVLPAGIADDQKLMVVDKTEQGRIRTREILAVRFSELEGEDRAQTLS
jgi:protein-L-isoaspartate(D-aspartate) O-methyltransferase